MQTHVPVDARVHCHPFHRDYDAFRRRPGRLHLVDKGADLVTEELNFGGGKGRGCMRAEIGQRGKKSLGCEGTLMN